MIACAIIFALNVLVTIAAFIQECGGDRRTERKNEAHYPGVTLTKPFNSGERCTMPGGAGMRSRSMNTKGGNLMQTTDARQSARISAGWRSNIRKAAARQDRRLSFRWTVSAPCIAGSRHLAHSCNCRRPAGGIRQRRDYKTKRRLSSHRRESGQGCWLERPTLPGLLSRKPDKRRPWRV